MHNSARSPHAGSIYNLHTLRDALCWRGTASSRRSAHHRQPHVMWVSIWASATALLLPQPRQPVVRAGGISRIAPRVRACAAEPEVHTGHPNPNPGPSPSPSPSPNPNPSPSPHQVAHLATIASLEVSGRSNPNLHPHPHPHP